MSLSKLDYSLIGITIVLLIIICFKTSALNNQNISSSDSTSLTFKTARQTATYTKHVLERDDLPQFIDNYRTRVRQRREERMTPEPVERWQLYPHPLPETLATSNFGWTGKNLKGDKDLDLIASNSKIKARLQRENEWTTQRELVYLKEPFFENAKLLLNKKKSSIEVPGLEGKTYEIIVPKEKIYLPQSGEMFGSFSGHLKGNPEASVYVGMCGKSWSVEIPIDSDKLIDITGRPNIKGEWVVAEIDLNKLNAANSGITCRTERTPDDLASEHQESKVESFNQQSPTSN